MEITHLSETVSIKTISEDGKKGVFEVEGLYAGYGLTLGNALRRTLLSSLPGSAITYLKIRNVSHEFSTLPGMKEDLIQLMLNFKKLRFHMDVNEPQVLTIRVKGAKEVTGEDVELNSQVQILNPEAVLATLTAKDSDFDAEITVERGLGYSAVESRKAEKLPIGVIALDAFFSPVVSVNYNVDNMRVGDRTDYNRLRIEIETDGTVSPSSALHKATSILKDHFEKVAAVEVVMAEAPAEVKEKPAKKKTAKKK
ncbi:MAG: DNA-directed RNA polymerase subunit alpha [Candidatus Liptonbacteria bacterium]|nr:DNA-directed RNA polymerase subunit alpha [Candidatus Liptonbacteria bacterium]